MTLDNGVSEYILRRFEDIILVIFNTNFLVNFSTKKTQLIDFLIIKKLFHDQYHLLNKIQ